MPSVPLNYSPQHKVTSPMYLSETAVLSPGARNGMPNHHSSHPDPAVRPITRPHKINITTASNSAHSNVSRTKQSSASNASTPSSTAYSISSVEDDSLSSSSSSSSASASPPPPSQSSARTVSKRSLRAKSAATPAADSKYHSSTTNDQSRPFLPLAPSSTSPPPQLTLATDVISKSLFNRAFLTQSPSSPANRAIATLAGNRSSHTSPLPIYRLSKHLSNTSISSTSSAFFVASDPQSLSKYVQKGAEADADSAEPYRKEGGGGKAWPVRRVDSTLSVEDKDTVQLHQPRALHSASPGTKSQSSSSSSSSSDSGHGHSDNLRILRSKKLPRPSAHTASEQPKALVAGNSAKASGAITKHSRRRDSPLSSDASQGCASPTSTTPYLQPSVSAVGDDDNNITHHHHHHHHSMSRSSSNSSGTNTSLEAWKNALRPPRNPSIASFSKLGSAIFSSTTSSLNLETIKLRKSSKLRKDAEIFMAIPNRIYSNVIDILDAQSGIVVYRRVNHSFNHWLTTFHDAEVLKFDAEGGQHPDNFLYYDQHQHHQHSSQHNGSDYSDTCNDSTASDSSGGVDLMLESHRPHPNNKKASGSVTTVESASSGSDVSAPHQQHHHYHNMLGANYGRLDESYADVGSLWTITCPHPDRFPFHCRYIANMLDTIPMITMISDRRRFRYHFRAFRTHDLLWETKITPSAKNGYRIILECSRKGTPLAQIEAYLEDRYNGNASIADMETMQRVARSGSDKPEEDEVEAPATPSTITAASIEDYKNTMTMIYIFPTLYEKIDSGHDSKVTESLILYTAIEMLEYATIRFDPNYVPLFELH